VYLLLLVGGGLIVPLDLYPEAARAVLALLPSAALGEGMRDLLSGRGFDLSAAVVLAAWAAAAAALAARTFRWE
jgi:ABC-2 type transport system permease protein